MMINVPPPDIQPISPKASELRQIKKVILILINNKLRKNRKKKIHCIVDLFIDHCKEAKTD